jgi:2'-5' RNA ligase
MWQRFRQALHHEGVSVDHNIHSNADTRRGVTALAYIEKNGALVAKRISEFLIGLKQVIPNQYFYPTDELHLTMLSIISCVDNFTLDDIHIPHYAALFQEALSGLPEFNITFRGVTATPDCVVIQGVVDHGKSGENEENDALALLRQRLRNAFKSSTLRSSIDARYTLKTAHCTAARFCSPLNTSTDTNANACATAKGSESELLLNYLERYRNNHFGTITIKHIDLVFNDWYQRLNNTKRLAQASLVKTNSVP